MKLFRLNKVQMEQFKNTWESVAYTQQKRYWFLSGETNCVVASKHANFYPNLQIL